jgi:hypothetical protein
MLSIGTGTTNKGHNKEQTYGYVCKEIIGILKRNLTSVEIKQVCSILESLNAADNTFVPKNIHKLPPVILKAITKRSFEINDNPMAVRNYMMDILNSSDNPIKKEVVINDSDTKNAVELISFKLDNNLLRTQFVTQYIVLDNYYLESLYKNSFFLTELPFQFTTNDVSSNNSVVALKYPLSNIIRFDIQTFYIPYYGAYSGLNSVLYNGYNIIRAPPGKRLQIYVKEIIEAYKTSPDEDYTMIANCQYDTTPYDGTNLPFISTVTPTNASIFTFHYPLKYLTTTTISFGDMLRDVLLPSPFLYSNTISKATPTTITVSNVNNPVGTFFIGGERIYITEFKSTSASDAQLVLLFNSPEGHIVSITGNAYQFTIPVDSSAMVGNVDGTFRIFVACRRIVIPVTIQQLRPEVGCEIN